MFDSYKENTLEYSPERCINCRRCTQVCPHGVFAEGEKRVELARQSECMECGACALNCPTQALAVESGVGCAWAMIAAALRGKDMDACTCGGPGDTCCGGGEEETHSCCGEEQKEESPSCCSGPGETRCGGEEKGGRRPGPVAAVDDTVTDTTKSAMNAGGGSSGDVLSPHP